MKLTFEPQGQLNSALSASGSRTRTDIPRTTPVIRTFSNRSNTLHDHLSPPVFSAECTLIHHIVLTESGSVPPTLLSWPSVLFLNKFWVCCQLERVVDLGPALGLVQQHQLRRLSRNVGCGTRLNYGEKYLLLNYRSSINEWYYHLYLDMCLCGSLQPNNISELP